ncbi:aminoglycoside phosphotransferase family protein [Marinovum sp.]|uniref:aminoglycoside phosphotransferase family protein n=1 Tax=Marinovum sp. TaxID=2024839 RepID=UPI002B2683A4|nr:phosphotransferase [Marinovum sp.]
MSREDALQRFLSEAGRDGWARRPLAGDASARRYERISGSTGSLILMDANPATCGSVQPFLDIRTHLFGLGFSAPALWAEDVEAGFLLLEDFGDALFAEVMARDPAQEHPLYRSAADLLARLHEKPLPQGMQPMTAEALAAMIAPAFEAYAPEHANRLPAAQAAFAEALKPVAEAPAVLALRDFHAENMVHLPGRKGDRQVGLLDFQDAFATHPAYDLVSMLQDARRDLSPGTEDAIIAHFAARTGTPEAAFRTAYALLGAQRNLRILGIFSRLAVTRGKPQYLALQPRVWRHLQADLAHPALARLRDILAPLPSPEVPA